MGIQHFSQSLSHASIIFQFCSASQAEVTYEPTTEQGILKETEFDHPLTWGVFFHCVLLLPPPTSVSLSLILSRFPVTLSGRKVDVLVSSYPSKISHKECKCFAKIICSTYIHLMWTSHYLFLICCISFQLLNYRFHNQIYGNEMLYSYFKPYKSHTI